ncbi:MAG: regulatory protein RecX [Thermomicrobiales bacterium]|jgi:regulatory protein|nr:regulatory protein RecX [Thermomicrobiales bacterium]
MPSPDETSPQTVRAGRVTALRPTKRDPDRIAVDLNGSFAFALPATLVADERIDVGEMLDGDRVSSLLAADEASRATEAALVFLGYRPRSEKEVRDRLRRGGYEQDAIEHAIARLHEWRYLDDADFARRWVENRTAHRPRGRRLLQQELRHKGIDGEIARDAIDDAELDETGAAEALARRRLPSYAGDEPAAIRRRLGAYLARRGYGYDVIRVALDRALGEADDDEGDGVIR